MRLASSGGHPEGSVFQMGRRGLAMPPRAQSDGQAASPASGVWQGLLAQDTRTLPLDLKRAYVPSNTRFSHD
jgi:hypothetical protein